MDFGTVRGGLNRWIAQFVAIASFDRHYFAARKHVWGKQMLSILVAASLAAGPAGQSATAQNNKPASSSVQAPRQLSVEEEFVRSGFLPIEEMKAGNREVRRLILRDPYGALPIPGLELERRRDGTVTLRQQFWSWRTKAEPITDGAWDKLAAMEAAALGSPSTPFKPDRGSGSPPGICHGWLTMIESSKGGTARWWECVGASSAVRDYAVELIRIAMATRPQCEDKRDPFWSFTNCFSLKQELDDPALQAAFSRLGKDFRLESDQDVSVRARRAVETPGLRLGSQEWIEARAAVRMVGQSLNRKRSRLQELVSLDYNARDASPADRERLRQAITNWRSTLTYQTENYADLLRRLVWAAESAEKNVASAP